MRDAQIRENIFRAVGALGDDLSRIEVQCSNGRAILAGAAKSWFEADEIERTVWLVPGVKRVDNRLVYPEGGETAEIQNQP